MTDPGTPVVFVHGLWLHHTSWGAWEELFAEHGYVPTAPGWPGEPATVAEARSDPAPMAPYGITEVTDHYAGIIAGLDRRPVVVGHSFGGLVVQQLLGRGLVEAAVSIDAAPIKGVLPLPVSSLRVASIALRNPANRNRTVGLTPAQFRYGFANTRTAEESAELYEKWVMPSPGRPLFQAASANFTPRSAAAVDLANSTRGPLLLTLGGRDHTVGPAIPRAAYKLHRKKSTAVTDLREFPGQDHSLCLNSDWREVADAALTWLKEQRR